MHARIGYHPVIVGITMPNETWVVVMGRRTGSHTIVASGTAIQVDHHRLGAVDESFLNQKFEQALVHGLGSGSQAFSFLSRVKRGESCRMFLGLQMRKYQGFNHLCGNSQDVDIADRTQA